MILCILCHEVHFVHNFYTGHFWGKYADRKFSSCTHHGHRSAWHGPVQREKNLKRIWCGMISWKMGGKSSHYGCFKNFYFRACATPLFDCLRLPQAWPETPNLIHPVSKWRVKNTIISYFAQDSFSFEAMSFITFFQITFRSGQDWYYNGKCVNFLY